MQLVQRGSVIFATLFVYDQSGKPSWYSATLSPTATAYTWSGDLLLTNGPWFGAVPFNPATVTYRKVGTISWDGRNISTGTVSYSVDGIGVTKSVVRQLLQYDDYSGTYMGAMRYSTTGCSDPTQNTHGDLFVTFQIIQNGQSITMAISGSGLGVFTVSGTLAQAGQFGTLSGTYTSTAGEVGNAGVELMNVQVRSFTGLFFLNSTNKACQTTLILVGMWQS